MGFKTAKGEHLRSLVDVLPWLDKQDIDEGWGSEWRKENEDKDKGKGKNKGKNKDTDTDTDKDKDKNKKGSRNGRPDYMTGGAFLAWLKRWQHSIVSQDPNRKVLLLVDNHGSHTVAMRSAHEFPNIRVVPLPPNSTSVTQPLDAGIIAVFKRRYRHLVAGRAYENKLRADIIAREEAAAVTLVVEDSEHEGTEEEAVEDSRVEPVTVMNMPKKPKRTRLDKVSNFEGWELAAQAWSELKPQSIRNCFAHVPILSDVQKKELRAGGQVDPDVHAAVVDAREDIADRATSMDQTPRVALLQRFPEASGSADFENAIENHLDPKSYTTTQRDHFTRLSSLLDGSPFLTGVIQKQCESNKEFRECFNNVKPATTTMLQDDLFPSEDDEDDEDYINDATHGRQPGLPVFHSPLPSLPSSPSSLSSPSSPAPRISTDSLVLTAGGVIFAPPGTVVSHKDGTVVLPARKLETKRKAYSWMTDDLRSSDISDQDLVEYEWDDKRSEVASEDCDQDRMIRVAERLPGNDNQRLRHDLDVAGEKAALGRVALPGAAYMREYNKRMRQEEEDIQWLYEENEKLQEKYPLPNFELEGLDAREE